MSTPYNTGKVKIGAAYTPRLRPEVAHGITGPHTRPFFDRHDRIVMRACLLAIVVFSLIQLAGCTSDTTYREQDGNFVCSLDARAYRVSPGPGDMSALQRAAQADTLCAKLKG